MRHGVRAAARLALIACCFASSFSPTRSHAQRSAADSASVLSHLADSLLALQSQEPVRRAIVLYLDASAQFAAAGRAKESAFMLHQVGRAHDMVSALDSAIYYYRLSLARRQAARDLASAGRTLVNLGATFGRMTEYDSAFAYLHRAEPVLRDAGDVHAIAVTQINLGSLHSRLGHPDSALAAFLAALAPLRQLDLRRDLAIVMNNVGAVYDQLGRVDSALTYFRRALSLRRLSRDKQGEAETLTNLGGLLQRNGRIDSAFAVLGEALRLRVEAGDRMGEITSRRFVAEALEIQGALDSALSQYRRSLQLAEELGDRLGEGYSLEGTGRLLARRGFGDSAFSYLVRSLAVRRSIADVYGVAESHAAIGRLYRDTRFPGHDARVAAMYFDSATTGYGQVQLAAGGDANRLSFGEAVKRTYEDWALAELASDTGGSLEGLRRALEVSERGRARALRTLRSISIAADPSSRGDPPHEALPSVFPSLERLARAGVATLSFMLARDTLLAWLHLPDGSLELHRLGLQGVSVSDAAARAVALLANSATPRASGTSAALRSARDAMVRMEGRPSAAAFDHQQAHVSELGRADLAQVLQLLSRLAFPPSLLRVLASSSSAIRELVVIPYGPLGVVPFALLPVGADGVRLGDLVAIRSAPSIALALGESLSVDSLLRATDRRALRSSLVVGDPRMPRIGDPRTGIHLQQLPGARRESRWIGQKLGAATVFGRSATESFVKRRLAEAPIVHLATHAFAFGSDAQVRNSFLALAPDSANDGLLTVAELLDHGPSTLRLQANLVVLSACQTGSGQVLDSEGIVGIARAFLARGARTVMVSQWSVSDQSTELLMRRFYTRWLDDADRPSKAEALRRAQRDVRETAGFAHPRYWAGFQLIGAR